jgi:glycine betaine/proline transport system substrate-binding protein
VKKNFLQSRLVKAAMTVAALGFSISAASAAEPLKIAYTNWADVMATVNVAKYVLETKLNQPVKLVNADIGVQYESVAHGDADCMLGAWLPDTHAVYYKKFKNDMVDLGVIYSGGQNGWAVPTYIPKSEVSSIADLAKPEVKSKLNATITGIEPGSGLMMMSSKALDAYGLKAAGYTLQSSSEAGMLSSIARAYPSKQWIVVTVWRPHWLFQKWGMRFLKDPKGVLGEPQQVHGFASKEMPKEFPRAYTFLTHFKMTLADIEQIEAAGEKSNDYPTAAKDFVNAHPELLKAWLAQ